MTQAIPYAVVGDRLYPCVVRADGWLQNIATHQVSENVPIVVKGEGAEAVAAKLRERGYRKVEVQGG